MPFKLSWYQPDRVVLIELEGVLTTTDIRAFTAEAFVLIASGKPLVHAITDARALSKIESIPETIKAVQGNAIHPNSGWFIMVGTLNPVVSFASDFVATIMRARYRRFDTLPEALTFLKERDESLQNMPINLS